MNSITVNVGGRRFTTLQSTLTNQSSFFAALLSGPWGEQACQINGEPFVDANPDLFDHILNYLRRSFPPIFWTRASGFDVPLYTAVLREAEYFGVTTLADWIREKKYIHTVRITPSIELEQVSDCRRGLRPFWGDTEKQFEPGTLSTASNSGKSTTLWQRLLVQKIEFCPPVRLSVVLAKVYKNVDEDGEGERADGGEDDEDDKNDEDQEEEEDTEDEDDDEDSEEDDGDVGSLADFVVDDEKLDCSFHLSQRSDVDDVSTEVCDIEADKASDGSFCLSQDGSDSSIEELEYTSDEEAVKLTSYEACDE